MKSIPLTPATLDVARRVIWFEPPEQALSDPTIQVVTFYPGASPDVMASSVTAPLERQFGQVPGLNADDLDQFGGQLGHHAAVRADLNIDVAEQEVQAAINAAQTYLPADLPKPPIYSKTNPADTPILTLALTSRPMPLSKVEDLADTRLAQKISQLPGVGLVSISGGQKPAVRIQANPTALSSYGLNLEDVRTALRRPTSNQAKGNFDGPQQATRSGPTISCWRATITRAVVVAYRNGAPVMLSDVADVDGRHGKHQAGGVDERQRRR